MSISKIMIVDDNNGDQLMTKIRIRGWNSNIEIIQAFDGEEALEILSGLNEQPDVIFLGISMPGMDGHEFLTEYSKRDHQSIVIAMSTFSNHNTNKEKTAKYGFVKAHFMKTLDNADIEFLKGL